MKPRFKRLKTVKLESLEAASGGNPQAVYSDVMGRVKQMPGVFGTRARPGGKFNSRFPNTGPNLEAEIKKGRPEVCGPCSADSRRLDGPDYGIWQVGMNCHD